jgi:hypothetical protein
MIICWQAGIDYFLTSSNLQPFIPEADIGVAYTTVVLLTLLYIYCFSWMNLTTFFSQGMEDSNSRDRQKQYLTLNRCPLGNYEWKTEQIRLDSFKTIY